MADTPTGVIYLAIYAFIVHVMFINLLIGVFNFYYFVIILLLFIYYLTI